MNSSHILVLDEEGRNDSVIIRTESLNCDFNN